MAQHDYVIDNQTAPNFRSDLNNALAAIVSTNSGSSEPSTTYANMLWYDSTNNILKMRNEADDAWINLGTLDQSADTFAANVALASQAEAEAGTNNTKTMTPLRTAQAITALSVGMDFIVGRSASDDATVEFTEFDATKYGSYMFVLSNVIPATDGALLYFRTSSNGGSSYDAGASDYKYTINSNASTGGGIGTGTEDYVLLVGHATGSAAGEDGISGTLTLTGAGTTKKTSLTANFGVFRNDGAYVSSYVAGARDSAAIVNGVQFLFSTGNVESGTIEMYGLRNS